MRLNGKKDAAEAAVATEASPAPKPKKKKHTKLIVFLVILALLGVAVRIYLPKYLASKKTATSTYVEETVSKHDIVNKLTASGTLEPADSYTVTSLVEGEVLTADFDEGDTVSKDDVLYTIDSSDASTSLTKAKNSLSQAEKSYERAQENLSDLNVKSTASGEVVDLAVSVGDDVNAGTTVATVRDSSKMDVKLYFPTDEAQTFYAGEAATVTLDGSFETIAGTVTAVSASDEVLSGNRIVRKVTIEVANPGAITNTSTATATVGTSACAQDGTFEYKAEKTVTASVNGTVAAINVSEGDTVSKNQTILTMTSDSLSDAVDSAKNAVEDAQLSLDNQNDTLDNYTITSPIDGTIIDKEYKQGDSYESGKTLCVIYDLSYLTFTMNIDELDISNVAVGQTVDITADAVSGKTFEGTVTKVSVSGTTSNSVTSYPVTVKITDTDGLLPGMNIDAEIILSESDDVIAVPVSAVSRGNLVLVKRASGTDTAAASGETESAAGNETSAVSASADTNAASSADKGSAPSGSMGTPPSGGSAPSGNMSAPSGSGDTQSASNETQSASGDAKSAGTSSGETTAASSSSGTTATTPSDAPAGYEYVEVTLGVSDDDYIEVKSGLSEGDSIAYVDPNAASSSTTQQTGGLFGMTGGSQAAGGGGMPSGGGGMPSGGGAPNGGPGGN